VSAAPPARSGQGRLAAPAGRAASALACLAMLVGASAAHAEGFEEERSHALELGLQAYEYGQPLLDTERIFKTVTSVTVPDHLGDAPVNQFSHYLNLITQKRGITAPNVDTLYSTAWLDLTPEPIVLHVPPGPRFNVVELLSPYTEDFANIGTGASGILPAGDYVIAGPKQLPGRTTYGGMPVVRSPYTRVWVIDRTLVNSAEDLPAAVAEQEATKLVPLEAWSSEGVAYQPPPPAQIITRPKLAVIPGTGRQQPLEYWTALGRALGQFPPPAADAPLLERLATVNVGANLSPSSTNSGEGTLAGLSEAVGAGRFQVLSDIGAELSAGFAAHNGWLLAPLGNYGTNYELRAITDRLGIAALTANVATYLGALTDRVGATLNGASSRYVAHFPASDFPVPVLGFWSVTLYRSSGRFVQNALDRFTLGNRSPLHFNPDGSLDIYLQNAEPSSETQRENWLPAPAGGFQLVLRLYGVNEAALPGLLEGHAGHWQPPTILRCLQSGKTLAGWACAE